MKCVYEAANGVEAHMIANLLEQQRISARIDGEHLTSGIGDLPAMGLVRVMADEADYDRAREIIRQWEAATPSIPIEKGEKKSSGGIWFVAGVATTIGVMALVSKSSEIEDGIDFNGDGRLDETYTYTGRFISKSESDRNFDGKMDEIYEYDSRGVVISSAFDEDFDGRFETKGTYERGHLRRAEIDINGDNKTDIQESYTNGVLTTAIYFAPNGYRTIKLEHYSRGRLVSDELDTNDDGTADTFRKYDSYGEIVEIARADGTRVE
jgi:hypothetical protein